MPILNYKYYSNYYLVQIDVYNFLSNFGLSGANLPPSVNNLMAQQQNGSILTFFASAFERKIDNSAQRKLLIQGRPGTMVQDVLPLVYTYTFTVPLFINQRNSQNPYVANSINGIAQYIINQQYLSMINPVNPTQISDSIGVGNAFLENYKINVYESETTLTMTIKFSAFEEDLLGWAVDVPSNLSTSFLATGRMIRNYDVGTQLSLYDGTNTYVIDQTGIGVYLEKTDFEITFETDPKLFINTQPEVNFIFKTYKVTQNFGIAGLDTSVAVGNFNPGILNWYDTQSTVAIQNPYYLYPVLIQYYTDDNYSFTVPSILKKKGQSLKSDNLTSTLFEFELYGGQSNGWLLNQNLIL